jgi:hypothetical protein
MSFQDSGQILTPQKGQTIRGRAVTAATLTTHDFASIMRDALRRGFSGPKAAARAAKSSPDTADNWWDGRTAPSGPFLVRLMSESDEVFTTILELAGRADEAKRVRIRALLVEAERILGVGEVGNAESEPGWEPPSSVP